MNSFKDEFENVWQKWSASWIEELLLTARQKTKLRNVFNNNMSTDLKLSKAQMSKIIQSGWFLGSLLSKLASPSMKVALFLWLKIF